MSLYLGDIPIANDGLQRLTGEIGDIGIAPFGIDESLNLRRYLNGQVISQTQFEAFTNKVKSAIALYPNLEATEENWQAEVTASVLGQCGKFVVDDEAGTIRLPKVVNINGLQDLALIGGIKAESLPNITGSNGGWTAEFNDAQPTGALVADTLGQAGYGYQDAADANKFQFDIGFDASHSSSTYQDNAPVQQEAIQYPYYIQVATGIEETLPAIREYGINTPFFFGWSQYFENAPYNASLLASLGQYNSASVYPDLWTQLTGVELNTSLNVGDTIEISGKTYVKRGLPVVLSTDTVTDYDFVVDQDNNQFRLPLLNGSEDLPGDNREYFELPASTSSYTAKANGTIQFTHRVASSGQFIGLINQRTGESDFQSSVTNNQLLRVNLQVSRGDSFRIEYQSTSTTTTSNTLYLSIATGNGTLYYYVGDVVQDASLINTGAVLSDVVDLKQTTLRTNQITNCITEIPQDIKLELNNGVLTLKAGSKIYMPNGFEEDGTTPKFDELVLSNDFSPTITPGASQTLLLYVRADGSTFDFRPISLTSSGSSDPATKGTHYYNTATNKLICYFAGGGSAEDSFPIALFTTNSNGVVSSIDQIFNGFGYMGSTVFALPGVKGLVPNGRNVDRTLKNIEFTTDSVWLGQTAYNTNKATLGVVSDMKALVYVTDDNVVYDDSDNKNKLVSNGTYWEGCFAGAVSVSDMKFTSVKPKLPFQAVDRNDSSWLSGLGMPSDRYIDLTLLASGNAYTAPANGWFLLSKDTNSANQYIELGDSSDSIAGIRIRTYCPASSGRLLLYIPIGKGRKIYTTYNAGGTTNLFRFIYAEGETDV